MCRSRLDPKTLTGTGFSFIGGLSHRAQSRWWQGKISVFGKYINMISKLEILSNVSWIRSKLPTSSKKINRIAQSKNKSASGRGRTYPLRLRIYQLNFPEKTAAVTHISQRCVIISSKQREHQLQVKCSQALISFCIIFFGVTMYNITSCCYRIKWHSNNQSGQKNERFCGNTITAPRIRVSLSQHAPSHTFMVRRRYAAHVCLVGRCYVFAMILHRGTIV